MVRFSGDDVRALFPHSSHQHGLRLVATTGGALFQCDGCRQVGAEMRYRCEQCDFDLHLCCAQAPSRLEHPMFEGCALTFFRSRPATPAGTATFCDVCGDQVLGFLYHSREHNLDIHPFCAILPKRMRIGADDGPVMVLVKDRGHNCGLCGEVKLPRNRYLSYRFRDDDGQHVYFHVACAMEVHYSSDDNVVVQANSTTIGEVSDRRLATLQNAPASRTRPRAGPAGPAAGGARDLRFRRFCEAAFLVARVSYSVATMDPVGLVTAVGVYTVVFLWLLLLVVFLSACYYLCLLG